MDSIIDKGERLLPAMFSGRMRRIRLATSDGELWGYTGAIGRLWMSASGNTCDKRLRENIACFTRTGMVMRWRNPDVFSPVFRQTVGTVSADVHAPGRTSKHPTSACLSVWTYKEARVSQGEYCL